MRFIKNESDIAFDDVVDDLVVMIRNEIILSNLKLLFDLKDLTDQCEFTLIRDTSRC